MSLRQQLKDSTGLVLQADVVERAVRERMLRLGLRTRADYAPCPGTPEFEALVELVVVPESWMFRDPDVFETALRFVQRRLLRDPGRPLRVLSLPCAGGEEPYSMAMALAQAGIPPAMCRIDAVDLSRTALARAARGRYTRNAFRGADLAFRERWFRRDGDEYAIDDALRHYVRFSQGNLLRAAELAADGRRYDLVFCRNLLIYFDDAGRAAAAAALHALLAGDGLLLSGFAEAPAFCLAGFAPPSLHFAYALQKQAVATVRRRPAQARAAGRAPAMAPAPALAQPAAELAAETSADSAARLREVRRLADAGRLLDAGLACHALLAREPALAEAWFLLGLVSECSGQPAAAERHLRRCLYLQPGHYEALCSLALMHEERGDAGQGALLRERAARARARQAASSGIASGVGS